MVVLEIEKPTEEYISVRQAAKELGVCAVTMFGYIKTFDMHKTTFPLDRRTYLLVSEFEKVRSLREAKKQRRAEEKI